MNHLYDYLVAEVPGVDDMLIARELAISVVVQEKKPPGLPTHMWKSAQECAENFLDDGLWYWHLFLCLLLVQRRTASMEDAEIIGRKELEDLLLFALFGRD
jgi:hypothetical protein